MRRFDQEWQLLVSARTWLRDRGYRLVDSRGPEGMDQGVDVYAGDRLGIKIWADRSQWFVDIGPLPERAGGRASIGWFPLEAWSACLGSPVLLRDARPTSTDLERAAALVNSRWLEPQLDYLRDHVSAIEVACSPGRIEATLSCVSEAQRALSAFPPRPTTC
jgi:hypothetical protein